MSLHLHVLKFSPLLSEASFNLLHNQSKAPLLNIIRLVSSLVLSTNSNHLSETDIDSVRS